MVEITMLFDVRVSHRLPISVESNSENRMSCNCKEDNTCNFQ